MFRIAAIAVALVNVFLFVPVAMAQDEETVGRVAYLVGVAVGCLALAALVYGVTRLLRRGKPPFRFSRVAFWTLSGLLGINLLGRALEMGLSELAAPLTDAERHGLEIRADSITHATLGFAMPSPSASYRTATQLQDQLNAGIADQKNMAAWVLQRADSGGTLVVQVTKSASLSETEFRAYARGLRSGAPKGGATIVRDTVTWSGRSGEYQMAVRYATGFEGNMRCVSQRRQTGGLIVCVTTGTPGGDELAFVREGLTLKP